MTFKAIIIRMVDRRWQVLCMADENHGYPMKVLDVQDLMNTNVLAHINSEEDPNSIPHNQIVMGDFHTRLTTMMVYMCMIFLTLMFLS